MVNGILSWKIFIKILMLWSLFKRRLWGGGGVLFWKYLDRMKDGMCFCIEDVRFMRKIKN